MCTFTIAQSYNASFLSKPWVITAITRIVIVIFAETSNTTCAISYYCQEHITMVLKLNNMQRGKNKFRHFPVVFQIFKWENEICWHEKLCHMPVGSVPKEGAGRPHRFKRHRHPATRVPMHPHHHHQEHHRLDWLFGQEHSRMIQSILTNFQIFSDFESGRWVDQKLLAASISSLFDGIASPPLHPPSLHLVEFTIPSPSNTDHFTSSWSFSLWSLQINPRNVHH